MSIETWRDGYQRGFLDGVQMREKLEEEQEYKLIKSRLERLAAMREEWDDEEEYIAAQPGEEIDWQAIYDKRAAEVNDHYDYYRAGIYSGHKMADKINPATSVTYNNLFKPDQSNYRIKPFDEVVYPDKCQECDGACKVC